MRPAARIALALLSLLAVLLPSMTVVAQETPQFTGSFSSTQELVSPLQPVLVHVHVENYSGPATLLVYDSLQRVVGSWDFTVVDDYAARQIAPRGALGRQWAVLFVSGHEVASGYIYTLDAQTTVQTGIEFLDSLYPTVRQIMSDALLQYELDGIPVYGYRTGDSPLLWIRDHAFQSRAYRYFDSDVTSLLEAFRRHQRPDGSILDVIDRPEYSISGFRTEVEADVEYIYIQLVVDTWRMTGDDAWLRDFLPSVYKALNYITSDPQRWDPWVQLVKRPFTIDTWDFEYGPTTVDPNSGLPAPRHWIDEQTKWGIFHGDNTGLAEALNSLAEAEAHLGLYDAAYQHRSMAQGIMERLNNLSWNGRFYLHHFKLEPFDVPGVDENEQLSLSNAIALNRGVLSLVQRQAILNEYRSRLSRPGNISFAEWWSIDPPFPDGSYGLGGKIGEGQGQYVNGGIMPLVGGELSRGAFSSGMESYGFDILKRYTELVERVGGSYLWYYPTGGAGIGTLDTVPYDGWGASAMFGGLLEGAAGVQERGIRMSNVTISPRWTAAPEEINNAYIVARYGASDGYVAYQWARESNAISLEITGSGQQFQARILLPPELRNVEDLPLRVTLNGQLVPLKLETVDTSHYVVVDANQPIVQVRVSWPER